VCYHGVAQVHVCHCGSFPGWLTSTSSKGRENKVCDQANEPCVHNPSCKAVNLHATSICNKDNNVNVVGDSDTEQWQAQLGSGKVASAEGNASNIRDSRVPCDQA